MIDEETRHEKVTMPLPNALQHHYTLINVETVEEGDFAKVEQEWTEMITKRACSTPITSRLLDMGIIHTYSYSAGDGTFLGSVTVRKSDCSRPK
jgi:hypothetical protein